jgi:hypothetical protein
MAGVERGATGGTVEGEASVRVVWGVASTAAAAAAVGLACRAAQRARLLPVSVATVLVAAGAVCALCGRRASGMELMALLWPLALAVGVGSQQATLCTAKEGKKA